MNKQQKLVIMEVLDAYELTNKEVLDVSDLNKIHSAQDAFKKFMLPDSVSASNKDRMLGAMKNFYTAAAELSTVWESLETQHEQWYASNEEYPFIQDFGVVLGRISSWIETTEDAWNVDKYILPDHDDRIKNAKKIAEYNNLMMLRGKDTGFLVGFHFDDLWIHDPFSSIDARFDPVEGVDPVEYYGEAFLKSEFYRTEDEIKALHVDIKLPGGITEVDPEDKETYEEMLKRFKKKLDWVVDQYCGTAELNEVDLNVTIAGETFKIDMCAEIFNCLDEMYKAEAEEYGLDNAK